MCARVKGWWEHNRVKANPTITQKYKKIQPCSLTAWREGVNRYALSEKLTLGSTPEASCMAAP